MNLWRFRRLLNEVVLDKIQELRMISKLQGLGSPATQHVLNVACWMLRGTGESYFEVGSWKGASFDAASRNCAEVPKYCCEETVEPELKELVDRLPNAWLLKGNFFDLDLSQTFRERSIGVFYYDGDHEELPTEASLEIIRPYLADEAIVIMDDLNYPQVHRAWRRAAQGEYQIIHELYAPVGQWGYLKPESWWNGFGIAEFERRK